MTHNSAGEHKGYHKLQSTILVKTKPQTKKKCMHQKNLVLNSSTQIDKKKMARLARKLHSWILHCHLPHATNVMPLFTHIRNTTVN